MNATNLWNRYQQFLCRVPSIGLSLDISRVRFDDGFLESMVEPMAKAFAAMKRIEAGAEANVDEKRMVGHYWLRAPQLAPNETIRNEIERTIGDIRQFADQILSGGITSQRDDGFYVVLVVGVGGSALGPQFISDALEQVSDPMMVRFIDNTDPDGIDRTLGELEETLSQTLTVVISKSGGTKETRNGMLEASEAYRRAGLDFAKHAVAVTQNGSALYQQAESEGWLRTFPMWDWVGGRTSVLSAVGLLPAALQGIDIDGLLSGARDCDEASRAEDMLRNPAALLAAMWYYVGNGRGDRNMVVLPYKDRLALFGKYLQQLLMESLGKQRDRAGREVHQGLTVFGNKGSSDQHSFVQQLRDGRNDFFVTFINVLRDREGSSIQVDSDTTAGDFLHAFWHGTREALYENARESITITLDHLDARGIGALIALFERAVGLYAELIDINAYHQPGVEAGKKAANSVLELQRKVLIHLRRDHHHRATAEEIANAIGESDAAEAVYHLLSHAAANPDHGVSHVAGTTPIEARFGSSGGA